MSKPIKGFITAPTLEQLLPTNYEKSMLKVLIDWQEQSAKSQIILGVPMEKQAEAHKAREQLERSGK